MILTDLQVSHLRNISSLRLQLHPHSNLFCGPNGSGKTSLLESIYLLSSGHSFRTREIMPLINHNEDSLTVFARTSENETISIQKSLTSSTQVKINMQSCYNSSELARFLPCQVFYQDIFQIMDAGPTVRRTLLDWGLFHVEPSYLSVWKQYRQVLKQRNALLRQKTSYIHFIPWDKQLAELGTLLDSMRTSYFERWILAFQHLLPQLSPTQCTLSYYKGWDKKKSGKSLQEILSEQFTSDLQRQYTHSGAHQADIVVDSDVKKAKLFLSRGEQKIVLIALKLAQASLITKHCLYIFDDLAAELDSQHLMRLLDYIAKVEGQFFFTATDEGTQRVYSQALDIKSHDMHSPHDFSVFTETN